MHRAHVAGGFTLLHPRRHGREHHLVLLTLLRQLPAKVVDLVTLLIECGRDREHAAAVFLVLPFALLAFEPTGCFVQFFLATFQR